MTSIFTETATAFVRVVDRNDWSALQEGIILLSEDDTNVLFSTLRAAGFKPKRIERGQVRGNYLDQDGSRSGKTYDVNRTCPYKVMKKDDKDDHHATGWLDMAVRTVCDILRTGSIQDAIDNIAVEIQRSRPLEPIRLTAEGDILNEYPPSRRGSYFVDHTRDGHELGSVPGVHAYCRGWIDRKRVSETHDALSCRSCNLRVAFPREITTYGELRSYFEQEHGTSTA